MGNLRKRDDPERKLRDEEVRPMLEGRDWTVTLFHNDKYQTGIPDLWAHHIKHGFRWIDTKIKERYSLTNAQLILWPYWEKRKIGVWIITAATDEEYDKLWQPPNWRSYQRPFEQRKEHELSQKGIDEAMEDMRNALRPKRDPGIFRGA